MKLTIDKLIKEYRKELKKIDATKSRFRKRFSPSFKSKVVSLVKSGEKRTVIQHRLQISSATLSDWIKKSNITTGTTPFKEVRVLQSINHCGPKNQFTIKTPSGYKIQIEHLQDLVSVIRKLESLP
jgi:hypothetical protein